MFDILKSLVANLSLALRLARREMAARYRGSILGALWVVVSPLLMLAVFVFVFSQIFASRWEGVDDTRQFALVLFAGLACFQFFTELLNRSASLFVEDRNYIKRLVFPVEILPLVALITASFTACISFAVLVIFHFVLVGPPSPRLLLVPLVFFPFAVLALGLTFAIASLGIFVRDLRQIFPWVSQVLMFMGPVLYPVTALPEVIRPYIYLNPMTFPIEEIRGLIFFERPLDWLALAAYAFASFVVLAVGLLLFRTLRPAFADVV